MKAFETKIDAIVQLTSNSSYQGKIINNSVPKKDELVIVEWDNGTFEKVNINELKIIPSEYDVAFEKMKRNFQKSLDLVRESREIASSLGMELQELVFKVDGFDEFSEIARELSNEIYQESWSSSSADC